MKSIKNILMAITLLLSVVGASAQIKNSVTEKVKVSGSCGMCKTTIEKVGSIKDFPENAINTVSVKVPNKTARFVKVIGINKGTIPVGEYGACAKAWLIVDELFIY